jgi:hypothetical protein
MSEDDFIRAILAHAGDTQAALERHFTGLARSVQLSPLSDWREELRSSLTRWLCAYLTDSESGGRLQGADGKFSLSFADFRQDCVEHALTRITALIAAVAAWRVDITPSGWYEMGWQDYALESSDRVLLLHLGVSD